MTTWSLDSATAQSSALSSTLSSQEVTIISKRLIPEYRVLWHDQFREKRGIHSYQNLRQSTRLNETQRFIKEGNRSATLIKVAAHRRAWDIKTLRHEPGEFVISDLAQIPFISVS